MIRFLAQDSLTFDLETVPDVDAGRRLYGLGPPEYYRIEGDGLIPVTEPGAMADGYSGYHERDVMLEMFRRHPEYNPDKNRRPFLKPLLTKVVSIATVRRWLEKTDAGPRFRVDLTVIKRPTEALMVGAFLKGVGKLQPQLVGFNSKDYDLPLLLQRAMVHRLEVPDVCRIPEKPWLGIDYHAKYTDWHVDLLTEIGGFGRSRPSLSEACAAMNILGGGKDIDGGDVLDLYLDGQTDTIDHYCATDAVRHFLLLLRLAVLAGHVPPEEAEREEADVIQQLENLTASVAAQ